MKATLSKVIHRDEERLKVQFVYNVDYKNKVHKIPGAKWSRTMKAWHLEFTMNSIEQLRAVFTELNYGDDETKALGEKKDRIFLTGDILTSIEEGYIYLKMPEGDIAGAGFLRKFELSCHINQSCYWKIKSTKDTREAIYNHFGSRLKEHSFLVTEINLHQQKLRNKNKAQCIVNGKTACLITHFDRGFIQFIKTLPYRRWDNKNMWWTFSYSEVVLNRLKDYCKECNIELEVEINGSKESIKGRGYRKDDPNFRPCPEEMVEKLKTKRYSESTISQYCSIFEDFINYHRKVALESLGTKEIKEYIGYLVQKRNISASYQNQAVNAIKFYYEKVLGGPRRYIELDRPKPERKLPDVLSKEEIKSMISTIRNYKQKCAVLLLYSAGLRRGELLRLQVSDIDPKTMRIHVRAAKGKKDRYAQLSVTMWEMLQEYIKLYEPANYLFEGVNEKYSGTSIGVVVKKAANEAGIKKKVTPHTLRHSYATHLLEAGTDTRFIQVLLGHESSRTTEIYTHITQRGLENVKNPLDNMEI